MVDDDNSFTKQRINVFITSVLLMVIQFADVTISDDVKIASISLKIGNPEFIIIFLLLLHVYFLIRFFQLKPIDSYSFKTLFYKHRMLYLAKSILGKVKQTEQSYKIAQENEECHMREIKEGPRNEMEDDYLESLFPAIELPTTEVLNYDQERYNALHKIANEIEHYESNQYRWQFRDGRGEEIYGKTIEFSDKDVKKSYFFGCFTVFTGSHFSTYQLPALIAFMSGIMFSFSLLI